MLNKPRNRKRPVRVAFICCDFGMGGAERWVISLASNLQSCRPSGLCLWENKWSVPEMLDEVSRCMPVYRNETEDEAGAILALQQATKEADVLLNWGVNLKNYLDLLEIPVIDVMHCAADLGEGFQLMAKASCTYANYIVCVTEAAATCLPENKRDEVTVIHNGADPQRVAPRFGREKTRHDLGFKESDKVALFIGRFDPKVKRPQKLLEAMPHLGEEWKAVIVGGDPTGKEKDRLLQEADRHAKGRVKFIPTTPHLGDLLAAADVLCVPSTTEGHCLVVNEAWLAGCPVVTCDYAAMKEFDALHGSLCWLMSVQCSGRQVAATLQEAVEAGRDSDRVKHAHNVAWQEYTSPAMAARWEAFIIDSVLPDWYRQALYY